MVKLIIYFMKILDNFNISPIKENMMKEAGKWLGLDDSRKGVSIYSRDCLFIQSKEDYLKEDLCN